MFNVHILVNLVKHKLVLYIMNLTMGDIAIQKVANQLYGCSEAGTVQLIHYLLNVNVSHYKADHIFVRTCLHKIVLFRVLSSMRWPIYVDLCVYWFSCSYKSLKFWWNR
jgi:hypothetical protein